MSLENHKITTYQDNVKDLPDYPSDAGITAIQLKNIFDGRTDKEIKEKFNGLIDELKEMFEEVQKGIKTNDDATETVGKTLTEHKGDLAAHEEVFARMQDEFTELINSRTGSNIQNGEGQLSLKQETWSEGSKNSAPGTGAVALGGYNKANAKCAVAVNYNNEVNAQHGFAANSANKIPEGCEASFVAGHCNEAKGEYQAVFGTYANPTSHDAFVIGNGDAVNGKKNAFKVDKSGNVEASGSIKATDFECKTLKAEDSVSTKSVVAQQKSYVGCGVVTEKDANYAQNEVKEKNSAAFGGSNRVYGATSFAALTSNTIPENCTHVFVAGHANVASGSHQSIFGTYANPASTDLFVIGNGTSAGRKNAFKVDRSGNAEVAGDFQAQYVVALDGVSTDYLSANHAIISGLITFGKSRTKIEESDGKIKIPTKVFVNSLEVLNEVSAYAVSSYEVDVEYALKIGSTTITEEQLKKLLALIS